MAIEAAIKQVLLATTLERLREPNNHDVIVVGAGAAGGLAALLLSEAGLRVLVLDAGLPSNWPRAPLRRVAGSLVRQLSTPEGLRFLPAPLIPKARRAVRILGRWRQPVQTRCFAWERAPELFVDDLDCPYVTPPDHPFVWVRARMLGGRLVIPGHGRQYYRLGPADFHPRDGLSPPWPISPGELDYWYALVEHRLALSGMRDGLPWLPDSEIANILNPSEAEASLQGKITQCWPHSRPILSRFAPPLHSLQLAAATGRLQCRQGAIVREIQVDGSSNVRGVVWIDHETRTEQQTSAPLVFLCASALESTRILMLSRSTRNPNGLGGNSNSLGKHLMDHVIVSAEGFSPHLPMKTAGEDGRCLYLPRFDARASATPDSVRGYGVQVYQFPIASHRSLFGAFAFAEMIPRPENRVVLDQRRDAWGVPVLRIECSYDEEQLARAMGQKQVLQELSRIAEAKLHRLDQAPLPPGSAVHECGTARMGSDPGNSVLDPNNECWDARGLYVTDGACFPSQGSQNPTLTILALTARACQHALVRSGRCHCGSPRLGPAPWSD
jgi:choline dehydrogenase-like flavoprotein